MPEQLKRLFKSGKLTCILIAVCCLAMVLLAFFPDEKRTEQKTVPEAEEIDATSYTEMLVRELQATVSAITGEAKPHVTVTLESMGKTVYAEEDRLSEKNSEEYSGDAVNRTQKDGNTERTYLVVRDADGGERALVVSKGEPEIRGVVIVSARGNEAVIRERITEAVRTMLNLSATQVFVTGQT